MQCLAASRTPNSAMSRVTPPHTACGIADPPNSAVSSRDSAGSRLVTQTGLQDKAISKFNCCGIDPPGILPSSARRSCK
ncbi:hypothetical protein BaRGS_00038950 [Batillaria attramentaria]|uniref:Uncharacterized protein n=1 Tax=Batillaria attramentaria TaxID=370345 RepID=A0ABD0J4C6_9CAEN